MNRHAVYAAVCARSERALNSRRCEPTGEALKLNGWSLYWLGWLLAFLAPELYWVFTNPADTLSETLWSVERLNLSQPYDFAMWTATHWIIALTVWLLFAWLSLHIPFGLLR
jgi:hypothetical protein